MIYYLDIWRKRYTTWEFEEKKLPGYLKERIYTWTYEGKDIYLDIWRKDILPGNLQERIYTWTYEGKEIPAYLKERIYFLDFWRKGYIYYLDIWRKGYIPGYLKERITFPHNILVIQWFSSKWESNITLFSRQFPGLYSEKKYIIKK